MRPLPDDLPMVPGPDCASCVHHRLAPHAPLGGGPERGSVVVALAGNPNTGKSTVFNALTGMRQHVGNWPGSTVTRAEGSYDFAGQAFGVVDLPGTYSLLSASHDEDVARDFLLFGEPDVVVVVVDATRLQRNLHLVLQILQITGHVVVALNLMDEARRHHVEVDVRHLVRELGVPVVPMSARRGEGVTELMGAVADVALGARPAPAPRDPELPADIARLAERLTTQLLAEYPGLPHARWLSLRLLEGDRATVQAVRDGRFADLTRLRRTLQVAS